MVSGYFVDDRVLCFVLGGAAVVQCAVQPVRVVPTFDVVEDRVVRGGAGRPGAGVDEFSFQGPEKRLRQGVVPTLAGAPNGVYVESPFVAGLPSPAPVGPVPGSDSRIAVIGRQKS